MDESRRYYSNFDPVDEGYIRENGLQIDKMFSYNDLTVKDSIRQDFADDIEMVGRVHIIGLARL